MSSTAQLKTVATAMTGAELATAARQTAAQAGSGTVKRFFEANKSNLIAVLPKHFDAERMLKLALGALRTTPKLANASNASLLGAVVTCAQLGLEPNTPLGHAYLLPFDKREKRDGQWVTTETQVTVIIGYKGMLDLARRSGQIVSIAAHEVCKNDEFRYSYGLDEELIHRPSMSDRGDVVGFYAVAKLVGGGYSFEVMGRAEVDFIRDKAAEKNRAKKDDKGRPIITGPWADNYIEMGRKTVLRRLFKYLPISIEMLSNANVIDGHAVAVAEPLEELVFKAAQEDAAMGDIATGEIIDQDDDQLRQIEQQAVGEQVPGMRVSQPEAVAGAHEPVVQEQQKTAGDAAAAALTFDQVRTRLENARDYDMLCADADLIQHISDVARREQLSAIFKKRSDEFKNPPPAANERAARSRRGTSGAGME